MLMQLEVNVPEIERRPGGRKKHEFRIPEVPPELTGRCAGDLSEASLYLIK